MAKFTINSKKYGPVDFYIPVSDHEQHTSAYVRITGAGFNNKQICEHGCLMGNTLTASPITLKKVANRWWKKFLSHNKDQSQVWT